MSIQNFISSPKAAKDFLHNPILKATPFKKNLYPAMWYLYHIAGYTQ